jgi:hypothetical protein
MVSKGEVHVEMKIMTSAIQIGMMSVESPPYYIVKPLLRGFESP